MGKDKEEKKLGKLEELELKQELEKRGLMTDIMFIRGRLGDEKKPPRFEYKIINGKEKEVEGLIKYVIEKIERQYIGVLEIERIKKGNHNHNRPLYLEKMIINPEMVINDEFSFRCRILRDIQKEMKNYFIQN
tara:strand:+ start:453 stop:851 length:399 start_codon:yes stop_codon:yes gene_type:complete